MSTQPVTLDMSTAQPIGAPVKLDMSTAQPIGKDEVRPHGWLDSVGDFAKEWWKQVNPVEAVKGLNQAAAHPIDTAQQLLQNQGQLAVKAEQAFKRGDYAEGMQHALNYLVPILGQQTDQAGDLLRQGEYAKGAGMTAGIGTNITAPELIKGNIKLPTGELPERMYQSALKPSTTLPRSQVQSVVQTGLQNEIPISAGGLSKLGDLVDDLGKKVEAQINASSNKGATVNKFAVASRLSDTAATAATQVNPEADLNAVAESGNEFLRNQPGAIPASNAQALKQGTYKQLTSKAYGEMGTATVEAQKALARGIKEELEVQFPEIKGLNASEGKLIGLNDVLQRAVKRIDNRDIFSLGGKFAAATGAAVGGAPGALAGFVLHHVMTDPMVQSRMAIALNKASSGAISISAAQARVLAYANQLGNATSQGTSDPNSQ